MCVKSATCHGWPYYYGTSKFLWYCTWPLLCTLATFLSQIMAKGVCTFPVMLFVYVQPPLLANLKSCIAVLSCCTYTEMPIRYQIYLLSNQPPSFSTSMHNTLEFSSGMWLLNLKFLLSQRVRYLFSNSNTCLYSLYCTFAHVTVHSSVFIVWSVFYKLATNISWAALNGTQGVQHRWVSLHSESACRHWDGTKTTC